MAHSLTLGMSHHHLYLLLVLTIHSGWASQVVLLVKDLPANAGDVRDAALISGLGRSPQRRAWQPTPVFLPGESYGQRSLAGHNPWGRKELDTTEETLAHTVLAGRTPGSSEALPLVLSSVLLEAQTSSPAAYSGPTCLQKGPAVLQTQ